jgi:hypothetical protein
VRLAGTLVAFAGLVLLVVGLFSGCGALFSWNGRHAVDVRAITPGTPLAYPLSPEPGRRYTVAVQVVFDRTSVPDREPEEAKGATVSAKLPIVARVTDGRGVSLAETTGWIDPEEAPTVLSGAHPTARQSASTELIAERMVGSFPTSTTDPIDVRIDLGEDRVGTTRIREARLVVYDDVMPPSIKRALAAAAVGGVAFAFGVALVFVSFFRGRARRGGIRGR